MKKKGILFWRIFISCILFMGCQHIAELPKEGKFIEMTLKKGSKLRYRFHTHASVGLETPKFEIQQPRIVQWKKTKYHTTWFLEPTQSGGDSEDGYFIFEAIDTGTTTLIIRQYYRNELETERHYHLTIK